MIAEKLPTLYELRFFPTRTDFSRTYTARFPRTGGDGAETRFQGSSTGQLIFRLAGPMGRTEVSWVAGTTVA